MSLSAILLYASLATGAPPVVYDLLDGAREESRAFASRQLAGEDLELYSGVGALHCRVHGGERTVTAFLVGAFNVAVTVAHAFEGEGGNVSPSDCTFVNTDADGQIVERIGVAEFRSKWIDVPSTRGSPPQDIAVARLERISEYAQRTLPFTTFDGNARDVTVVAYQNGYGGVWIKGKSRALVEASSAEALAPAIASIWQPKVVWVGRMPQPTASGAPVIDAASGVVIGVNQGTANGDLLVIDDWLTQAIRMYLQ